MKNFRLTLIILLLALLGTSVAAKTLSMSEKLNAVATDQSISIATRTRAAEQLCSIQPSCLKYQVLRGSLYNKSARMKEAFTLMDSLYKLYSIDRGERKCDLEEWLKLMNTYSVSLNYNNNYNKMVKVASEMLKTEKPDTLLHYDLYAYAILGQVAKLSKGTEYKKRIKLKMEEVLAEVEKAGYADDDLLKSLNEIIHKFQVLILTDLGRPREEIRKEINAMLTYATAPSDTTAYYLQMALEYHGLDLHEEADKYYAKILAQPSPNINTSVGLANYINSLNDRKEYQKVVEVASQYSYIIESFGLTESVPYFWYAYASALSETGNREEAVKLYDKAFMSMYNLFQGSTNWVNESLANEELAEALGEKKSEQEISKIRKNWIIILALVLTVIVSISIFLLLKLRKDRIAYENLQKSHLLEDEKYRMREKELTLLQMQLVSVHDTLQKLDEILIEKTRMQMKR